MRSQITSLLAMLVISYTQVAGQTTYYWNYGTSATGGNAQPTSGSNSNLTVGSFGIGNTNGSVIPLTQSSASSGYAGSSGDYNIGNAARTGGLAVGTNGSAYFSFSITPINGSTGIMVESISFGSRSTGTGPTAITLRSSIDNYTSDITTPISVLANSTWSFQSTSLTVSTFHAGEGNSIDFRMYGFEGAGSANSNTINWRIDDFSVIVTPVPEPTIMFSLGALMLAAGAIVRRKFRRELEMTESTIAA